jgi:hypothetical protein
VDKDVHPLKRFIIPFLIGVVVIAAEAIILLPKGPNAHFWARIIFFLAFLNGLGWGVLNVLRSKSSSIWIGMIVFWIFITGILIVPSLPMVILIFAMIALKTLGLWLFFALLLILSAILNKAGKLSCILSVLFHKPKEKVEIFLSNNKKRIYSFSAVLLIAPFVIITLFYVIMFLGWGPSIGTMGH